MKAKFATGADGWLAAFGRASGKVAVTNEQPRPESRSQIKLPAVGNAFAVNHEDTLAMLRKLKVSYGLARSQTMAEDTEPAFETAIEHELTSRAGYAQRGPTECAERQALFPADVLGFPR